VVMSVRRRLLELGGVATHRVLVARSGRREVARALESGDIVRTARGRYAVPEVDESVAAAHACGGVLSHGSAALAWGWACKAVPDRPHVTVPVKRRITRDVTGVHLHRRDLLPEEISDGRTSRDLTLEQCVRSLPFEEALAVADSALRDGYPSDRLRALARDARGPGSSMLRKVANAADGSSANPFESILRAICLEVPGLAVLPQVRVGAARVDLADEHLRLVLEADSFAWHGDRRALRRDAQRYNRMVVDGWTVLRFAWEDVMFCSDDVAALLVAMVARAQPRSNQPIGPLG